MPKIEAVKRRNWATTMQTPAAMSCDSLIISDVNAKAVAAMKLLTAVARSMILFDFILDWNFHYYGTLNNPRLPKIQIHTIRKQ